jgi:hypothetical protein
MREEVRRAVDHLDWGRVVDRFESQLGRLARRAAAAGRENSTMEGLR